MLKSLARTTLRAALALLLAVTGPALAPPALAQHVGDVSLTTTTQILANALACTGNPQNFPVSNLGQSFHLATAVSTAPSFVMEVDGTDAVANVFKISNPMITVGTQAFLVQGIGFLPIISVNVTCTAASTFSLSYSGSFASNPIQNVGAGGSGQITTTVGGNVQGMVGTGVNAFPIFPIVNGALQPAINAGFLAFGVDNFATTTTLEASGFTGNFTFGKPPLPSAPGEGAIAFWTSLGAIGGTGLLAPWTCITAGCGAGGAANALNAASVNNVTTTTALVENQANSNGPQNWIVSILEFAKLPTVRQQAFAANSTPATPGNTLAGSALAAAFECSNFPCQIDSVTDTQGNKWTQLTSLQLTVNQPAGISVWMAGPSSAAAETATAVIHAGSAVQNSGILELTNLTPASLNTPNTAIFAANRLAQPNENDNGGMFVATAGFSLSQTVTFSTAATNTFKLWDVTQNGSFSSCVLSERITNISGAGTTLNTFLQDTADGVGFNDRVSMPQATTALGAQNLFGAIPAFTATALTAAANGAVVSTDGALAAGSAIAGPIGPFGRIKFVTAGAAVSVTVTYNVVCR